MNTPMGKGIRLAIHEERWAEVRSMLEEEHVQNWFPRKWYYTTRKNEREKVMALHLVLQRNVPIDIVETIIQIEPCLLSIQSFRNQELPLHFAVLFKRAARPDIIERLASSYPSAITATSASGKTPLHVACEKTRPAKVIETLHKYNPAVSDMKDHSGYTPWDLLKKNTKPWNVAYRQEIKKILIAKDSTKVLDSTLHIPPIPLASTDMDSSNHTVRLFTTWKSSSSFMVPETRNERMVKTRKYRIDSTTIGYCAVTISLLLAVVGKVYQLSILTI
jgi:hypothetical protein